MQPTVTTEIKTHLYSQNSTDIVWQILCIFCTLLYFLLTFTVSHCTLLYISFFQHCTQLYANKQALTGMVTHCTPLYIALISNVTHHNPLYSN